MGITVNIDEQPPKGEAKSKDVERFETRVKKAISYLAAVNLPAFTSLLQVGEIVTVSGEDAPVPTACLMKQGAGYKIVLNQDFCEQFDQRQISGILFHEVLHHIMRHLEIQQFPNHELANIVYDAFINRTIAQTEPTLIGWARKFYAEDESPVLFLRPRSKPVDMMDKQMYRHLYKGNITDSDLYEYLDRRVPRSKQCTVVLVGSHDQPGQGQDDKPGDEPGQSGMPQMRPGQGKNPLEKEEVPELVRDLKDKLRKRDSNLSSQLAGQFEQLLQEFIRVNKLDRNATLEEAFRLSLVDTVKADLLNDVLGSVQEHGSQTVLMPQHPVRSDMIQVGMGIPIIFWKNPDYLEKQGDVRVYVDVSGSVDSYKDWIYGIILSLEEYLSTEIYLFSNKIAEVTVGEFAEGKVVSTFGTDFGCVLEHIIENNVEKAVIVTDGYASASPELIGKVKEKNVDIYSVVIGDKNNYYHEGVEKFSKKIFNLPKN